MLLFLLISPLLIFILLVNSNIINLIELMTLIKFYIIFFLISANALFSFGLIDTFNSMSHFTTIISTSNYNVYTWFMICIVLLVSSMVMLNAINYLSLMESYLFIFYIGIFQLVMISFVLSSDLVVTYLY